MPLIGTVANLPGRTGNWELILAQAGGRLTLMNGWYLVFCLPLFRFLMFRWLWRLGLWWYFLRRVEKLKLLLIPTHSDILATRKIKGVNEVIAARALATFLGCFEKIVREMGKEGGPGEDLPSM